MRYRAAILICALAASAATGCVTRTIAVHTDPPGAALWVNHRYVGRTPVDDLEFAHYGDYQITLRREGHVARSVVERIRPPWYERFGVDLFSESLLPARLSDTRRFDYKLERATLRSPEDVLAEAEEARAKLRELEVPGTEPAAPAAPAPGGEPREAGGPEVLQRQPEEN